MAYVEHEKDDPIVGAYYTNVRTSIVQVVRIDIGGVSGWFRSVVYRYIKSDWYTESDEDCHLGTHLFNENFPHKLNRLEEALLLEEKDDTSR